MRAPTLNELGAVLVVQQFVVAAFSFSLLSSTFLHLQTLGQKCHGFLKSTLFHPGWNEFHNGHGISMTHLELVRGYFSRVNGVRYAVQVQTAFRIALQFHDPTGLHQGLGDINMVLA
jgi:hypothetical protein